MGVLLRDSIAKNVTDYKLTQLLCSGSKAISEGKYVQARNAMNMLRDSIGLSAPREKYMATLCLSAISLAEKKYGDAIDCIKWILTDNSGINDADVHMEVYDLLSRYSALGGDSKMADYYRMKFYESKDSLMSGLVAIEPTRLGIEINTIQDNARKIEEEREKIWLWLIFTIIIVMALSVFSIIIYKENRALKLKNKVIFDQTQSILKSTAHNADNSFVSPPSEATSVTEDKTKVTAPAAQEKPEKYRDSSMTDETRRDLIGKIEDAMAKVDEICDSNFSLQKLTTLVGSNTSYISRTVNEHYGMTFGNLLNRYRVQEACRRMGDFKNYGHLTIEAISESVGFKTRATFVKAFRMNIGMLPSEYIKLLKKERNNLKDLEESSESADK